MKYQVASSMETDLKTNYKTLAKNYISWIWIFNIALKQKNKLKKRELALKQKEELAEGLHLIDFEQLKIENQTYTEKIEERNEDLLKFKNKIQSTGMDFDSEWSQYACIIPLKLFKNQEILILPHLFRYAK